jgi:predicted peptidase
MKAFLVAILLLLSSVASAADYSAFEAHVFKSRQGSIPYRLLKPNQIEAGKKYPLVLVLHGFGERGTDNEKQLKDFAPLFLKSAVRDKFPCFVVVPQAPGSWIEHAVFDKPIPLSAKPTSALALTVELVESTTKKDPVDPDRIYLLGYSNGACGVWDLLERLPRSWAAAVPMAGAGDPSHIAAAKSVPIWAFHGSKDPTIPIERMHEMESALHAAGGHPLYTIVKDGVHYDAKAKALADPSLLPWMFAQRRGRPADSFEEAAGKKAKLPTSLQNEVK